jgi:hypothetical protein
MKYHVSRRKFLLTSAGGAVVLLGAGAGLYFLQPEASQPAQAANSFPSPFPFDALPTSQLRASSKKAFAYYFPPYPISIENAVPSKDYYASWLNPDAKNGEYRAIGGLVRDRPFGRAPRSEKAWLQTDFELEIQRAIAIGLDGFILEVLDHQSADARWQRTSLMLDAAKAVDPEFRIMLSVDPPRTSGATPDNMVSTILAVKDHPSLYRLSDGRIVLAPFYPDHPATPLDWWKQLHTLAQAKGIDIALVPIYLSSPTKFSSWMDSTYGTSFWGVRNASAMSSYLNSAQLAHSHNNIWMCPIAPQDMRPNQSNYYESSNSQLFRKSWEAAISGNADWATMITWNDYSESTQVAPSVENQYVFADLAAYYVTWFKTGQQPAITRDVIYYFHRTQFANAQPDTSKQTKVIQLRPNTDAPSDKIELLAFLKEAGTLEVTIAGKTYQQQASAGVTSFSVPLAAGTPTFRLARSGTTAISLSSIYPIASSITYQDLMYHMAGSGRAPIVTRRYFKLINRKSNLALTDAGSGGAGTAITQVTSGSGTEQQWILVPGPDDYYQIQNKVNSLVMDIKDASTAEGAAIVLASSTNAASQLWQMGTTGDGYIVFTNKLSSRVLAIKSNSTSQNAPSVQYAYNQGDSQKWQMQVV